MERIIAVAESKITRQIQFVGDCIIAVDTLADAERPCEAVVELLRGSGCCPVPSAHVDMVANLVAWVNAPQLVGRLALCELGTGHFLA